MKIRRILKQAIFDQYWTLLFTTINFYMCTLYYFYFLSSRVIQLTPYFMILLVLIFIVNQNFKLESTQYFTPFFLCALAILLSVFFFLLLFALLLSHNYYCYLLITVIIYSLIYLFIYSYLLYHLFIYFVVLTCIRYNLLSPLPT